MKIISSFRSVIVLILTPVLTFLTSFSAIVGMFFFRVSGEKIQVLPRYWARIILSLAGVTVNVKGGQQLNPKTPYIFAANHLSQFDIFALQGYLTMDFRWLAKKELFDIPVFGAAMRMVGYIPVDRSRGRKALVSLNEAANRVAAGTSVVIFPEGTRSKDGKLHSFKSGAMVLAIKAGVPIVPVAIKGTYEVLPKGKLLARSGHVELTLGNPIETKGLKSADKQELATKLEQEVAGMLVSTS
nr:1-acyl-sn-glycerol-3-phosphate acyltransferase [Desulfobulbaceae bacterium]